MSLNHEARMMADKIEREIELRRAALLKRLGPLPEREHRPLRLSSLFAPLRALAGRLRALRATHPETGDDGHATQRTARTG